MIEGIDISDYQTVDSFHAAADSGIGFVYCKATEGTDDVQSSFASNRSRIAEVGSLFFGAYHFLDWTNDAVAQAEHFLSVYTPKSGDLPPMLDLEAFSQDPAASTRAIAAFLAEVERHLGGRRMILYTDWDAINTQKFVTDDFSGHPLWIAAYGDPPAPTPPATWSAATIWQYSGTGSCAGVEGEVDRDRYLGNDLHSFALVLP